jgi:hypothetical protein
MATQLQLRRGNTAQTVVFTGAVAEVTVDTDQDTVVVHDGVTVGGNYIVTKNQLESNVSLLNSINTTQNTNITAVNNYANSAYGQANSAFILASYVNGVANDAFFAANGANGMARYAANTANGATGLAAGAYNTANGANGLAGAAYGHANNAFNTANGANGLAQGAYNYANTTYSYTTQVQGIADGAFLKANAAFVSSNAVNGYAQSAYALANTNASNISIAVGVDNTQNTRLNSIETINTNQNTSITQVNQFAQAAYNTANLKFNSSGGDINGDVTITANNDLTVTGNLYVLGNTISFGTETLEVVDPMILLAQGNYTTDLLDIGFAGHYNAGSNAHTGLFRDAVGTKEWYFFEGYTPEVSGNNNIVISDPSFRTSNVNANNFKGNLIATTSVVGGFNIRDVQNTQNTNITAVNGYAASAYAAGNTNSTNITSVNNFAAGAYAQANTANTRAFSTVLKAGDTMSGSLTGVTTLGLTTISFAQVDATSNTFTTASTAQVSVDAWPTATYRSANYFVQVTSGASYHIIQLNLVHNGTTVWLAQYGEIITSASLGTFDADISGSTVRLLFTGVNAVSTVRVLRTVIDT